METKTTTVAVAVVCGLLGGIVGALLVGYFDPLSYLDEKKDEGFALMSDAENNELIAKEQLREQISKIENQLVQFHRELYPITHQKIHETVYLHETVLSLLSDDVRNLKTSQALGPNLGDFVELDKKVRNLQLDLTLHKHSEFE